MRYNSEEHLKKFYDKNIYPKIHDNIFKLCKCIENKENRNVIDLGSSIGLLSHRLSNHYNKVIGIECDKRAIEKAIAKENIIYKNIKLLPSNKNELEKIIKDENISVVVGRRVIPELYDCGSVVYIKDLEEMFYRNNIEYIILEGRIKSKNSTHKLKSIDEEVKILSTRYIEIKRYKNCSVLKRRG